MYFFWRRPPVPDHIIEGAKAGLANEIGKLVAMAEHPVGYPHLVDIDGSPVVWDQTKIDEANAEIARLNAELAKFDD